MKKAISLRCILAILLLVTTFAANAQQTAKKYVVESNYLLYLPDGYNASDTITKWPLLVFLHGMGETGTDIEKLKVHGPPKMIEAGYKFPFIVVSPQARTVWWKAPELLNLLNEEIIPKHNVDMDRLYLTGLSMGGFGTWDFAATYPNYFTAIIPICGGGKPGEAYKLRHTPVWCFHGLVDNVVPVEFSQRMIDAVRKYNTDAVLTIYPEANHDSWTETYNNPAIYEWLLKQKRFSYKQIDMDRSRLEKYSGKYMGEDGVQMLTISLGDNGLLSVSGFRQIVFDVKPASEYEFFINEHFPDSMMFEISDEGEITGVNYLSAEKTYYKKVD